ncbi:hypothetical protein ABIA48_004507 [Pseudomonas sp. S30_BP2TU TE3576]
MQAMQGDFTIILAPTLGPLATEDPCGSGLAREGCVSGDDCFVGVHIRCCGHGRLWFRSYSGSLWKSPKVTKGLLPLTFGASPWLGMPSLRSCSVGPPPSAIHGRGRLTRHPCRVAHCAEPALGLTRGRTPQKQSEAAYRPACLRGSFDCDVPAPVRPPSRASSLPQGIGYTCEKLAGWQAAFASKPAPTGGLGVSVRNWPAIRPPRLPAGQSSNRNSGQIGEVPRFCDSRMARHSEHKRWS